MSEEKKLRNILNELYLDARGIQPLNTVVANGTINLALTAIRLLEIKSKPMYCHKCKIIKEHKKTGSNRYKETSNG